MWSRAVRVFPPQPRVSAIITAPSDNFELSGGVTDADTLLGSQPMSVTSCAAHSGKRFYITTAIEYANGEPHLGHALEKIGTDAIARFHRLNGDDVHFLVGTDEHGQKVAQAAAVNGIVPREQARQITELFQSTWNALGISYDVFSHTTTARHRAGVLELIRRIRLRHPEAFFERAYEGVYCVGCEAFKTTHDLVDGACPVHPTRALERVSETNWFFRLSAFEGFVRSFLDEHPEFIQPSSRRNEVLAFVQRGLDDVSITRANLDWGVPFPIASHDGRHQVIYVWFDALPNYLTAVGFPDAAFEERWPAQVHVVGKDITRFHCVLWPAILHAAGLPLPERVWVHGFLSAQGRRLSKSEGVWVDLPKAIDRFGPDALRYYLIRDVPFDGDGDFSWQRFDARYTSDLANTLGNLASRVTALVVRCCEGSLLPRIDATPTSELERSLVECQAAALRSYCDAFAANRPHRALEAVFNVLVAGNEFIARSEPWKSPQDAESRTARDRVLSLLVALLARQAVLLSPAIPRKADALWCGLGGPGSVHEQRIEQLPSLDTGGWRVTKVGSLFPR
jgi:methionyl-tRNA synthetase